MNKYHTKFLKDLTHLQVFQPYTASEYFSAISSFPFLKDLLFLQYDFCLFLHHQLYLIHFSSLSVTFLHPFSLDLNNFKM